MIGMFGLEGEGWGQGFIHYLFEFYCFLFGG